MGRKKDKPKEIPIKFVDGEESASGEAVERTETADAGYAREAAEIADAGDPPAAAESAAAAEAVDPPQPQAESSQEPDLGNFANFALEMAEVQDRVETLTREKAALYDQVLRRQAEFENYRKRVDKDKAEFYQRMRAEVLLELLPVLDNFDRALASLASSEGDREALHQGVELIHRQFSEALDRRAHV